MSIIRTIVTLFFVSLSSTAVYAECEVDTSGVVHCAREPAGGAVLNREGDVECGKGQCDKDTYGVIMCSRVAGGGVARDRRGAVRCLGGCEQASTAMCVRAE